MTLPEPAHRYRQAAMLGVLGGMSGLVLVSLLTGWSLSPLTWYLARASGLTLYLLLWGSVMLGLGLTTGVLDRFGGRGVIYSTHRFATDLAYAMLALHLISLALDPYISFTLFDFLVPFRGPTREPWTGLGVIGAWMMVLLGVSLSLRRWIGHRGWRILHYGAFPLYVIGLAHGMGTGTDRATLWAELLYLGTLTPVVFLIIFRALRGPVRTSAPVLPRRVPADQRA